MRYKENKDLVVEGIITNVINNKNNDKTRNDDNNRNIVQIYLIWNN